MKKINQIWEELEHDTTITDGLLLRRYSGTFLPDVFVSLQVPEQFRCIAVDVDGSHRIDLASYSDLKDISIELLTSATSGKKKILIKLVNHRLKDIFSVLSEDLIECIKDIADDKQLLKVLINRLEGWKSLFDRVSNQGLNPQEQRGLFGELVFLRKLINQNSNKLSGVDSWVGCSGEIRDFQQSRWSVEVKTSQGNNHQKVHISNERQLDTSNLEYLYLFHLSLDVRHGSGESLNQLVDSIRDALDDERVAQNRFNNKLLLAGYFDFQRGLYAETGYFIRQETFFRVGGNFPRIEEAEIRDGVGDVSYTIILTQCVNYIEPEDQVFENILSNE